VVLVHTDAVKSAVLGVHQLLDVFIEGVGHDFGIEELLVNINPDTAVLGVEIFFEVRIRHQVEPHELHVTIVAPSTIAVQDRFAPRLCRFR
jgi:hypothetical protein